MSLNMDPIRLRIQIRIHNSTLEDKFFQRLKNQQQKIEDISSLYRYYFYTLHCLFQQQQKTD
jgi:hypothetical protein